MTEKRIVLTAAGSKEEAQKIARALVDRHLAACANIVGPVDSVFWWKGKLREEAEYLVIIKTMEDALDNVRTVIRELHSYELPEFTVLGIEAGSREYLAWIEACVR